MRSSLLALAPLLAPSLARAEEELLIQGTQDPRAALGTGAVTVIPVHEDLPPSADVAQVLDAVPGLTVRRLGGLGDWAGVSIRGSSLRQVQIHFDGAPLNPDGAHAINLAELPLQAFREIRVFRSGAPPEYAASPIGGVVDLRTGERAEGSGARVAVGSYDTLRGNADWMGQGRLGGLPVDALIAMELFSTEGDYEFFSDNGTLYNRIDDRFERRQNNDKTQGSGLLRLRLHPGAWTAALLYAPLRREEGVPSVANEDDDDARLQTRRDLVLLRAERTAARLSLSGQVWGQSRVEHYQDPRGTVGWGNDDDRNELGQLGAQAHGRVSLSRHLWPSLTVTSRMDRWVAEDLLAGRTEAPRTRLSLTLGPAVQLFPDDRLELSGQGLATAQQNRFGVDELSGRARGGDEDRQLRFDPQAGMRWRPGAGGELRANGGTFLRVPDLLELFGDRGNIVGNPYLRPEKGWRLNMGASAASPPGRRGRVALDLDVYYGESRDLIVVEQTSARTTRSVNVGRGRVHGVEGGLEAALVDRVDLSLALSRTFTRNLLDDEAYFGNQLAGIPAWEANAALLLRPHPSISLGPDFSYTDQTFWDATNWYRAAPRPIWGASMSLGGGGRWPVASLDVRNLLDRNVQVVARNPLDEQDDARVVQAIEDFQGYPLPGRTILFGLRWRDRPRLDQPKDRP